LLTGFGRTVTKSQADNAASLTLQGDPNPDLLPLLSTNDHNSSISRIGRSGKGRKVSAMVAAVWAEADQLLSFGLSL